MLTFGNIFVVSESLYKYKRTSNLDPSMYSHASTDCKRYEQQHVCLFIVLFSCGSKQTLRHIFTQLKGVHIKATTV